MVDRTRPRHEPGLVVARDFSGFWHRASTRVGTMFTVFAAVTLAAGLLGSWAFAPAIGWIAASGTLSVWIGMTVLRLGPDDTASHATREDPSRAVAQGLLLAATVASVGAIVLLLVESGRVQSDGARLALAVAALATVAASWTLIHVLFTLRYAGIYYRAGGTGVDFNQTDRPAYGDFAYLAFTLGMTYQVSDTDITSTRMRHEVLRHALLSFVFGVIVLAAAINLVVALASR